MKKIIILIALVTMGSVSAYGDQIMVLKGNDLVMISGDTSKIVEIVLSKEILRGQAGNQYFENNCNMRETWNDPILAAVCEPLLYGLGPNCQRDTCTENTAFYNAVQYSHHEPNLVEFSRLFPKAQIEVLSCDRRNRNKPDQFDQLNNYFSDFEFSCSRFDVSAKIEYSVLRPENGGPYWGNYGTATVNGNSNSFIFIELIGY